MPEKAFTVAEANFLIPTLEGVLDSVQERMKRIQGATERLQVLDLLWGAKIGSRDNPDYGEAQSHSAEILQLMGEIEELVEREIEGRGLRFPQGGLEHGLIDFPTVWEGRRVYLCWKRGEPIIEAWHEVDGGFSGRRTLTAEQVREMGRGPADASGSWHMP